MSARRIRRQLTNIEDSGNSRRFVNFNYSENFNRITELNSENYTRWKRNMIHLLNINDLLIYVTQEKVKKLLKRDIRENLGDYIEDQFDESLVYALGTDETDINNDITTQWIIMNSLSENTQQIIEGQANTAYKIWNLLRISFTKNQQTRKLEIKRKLDELKYDEEKDINIFMSELQNLIDDLEKIDGDMSNNTKAGILNRTLPEHLRYINVFQYANNWNQCTTYVKRVIPEIIISNNIESNNVKNNNTKNIFSTEKEELDDINHNDHNIKTKRISIRKTNKKRKNGRCNYCHKKGHYFYECKKRKLNRLKRKNIIRYNKYRNRKYKNKHHANFIQKDNYDNTFSKAFTKDYNDDDSVEINYLQDRNQHISTNDKELICWILDSGASINVTNRIDKLVNVRNCNEKLLLANNYTIIANKIGTFIGYINNQQITIHDVYYSQDINKNLLSIGRLIQQNYKIIFNSNQNKSYATIYDSYQNRIINLSADSNNTFKLWISTQPLHLNDNNKRNINNELNYTNMKLQDKLNLWHRRFAHFNIKPIKKKLLNTNIKIKCPLCVESKIKN